MKKKYIAPQTETTPYEIVSIIARSKPGYAIDNTNQNDGLIIDIEEDPTTGDDEWLDLW